VKRRGTFLGPTDRTITIASSSLHHCFASSDLPSRCSFSTKTP
jgi:hypothetical protein